MALSSPANFLNSLLTCLFMVGNENLFVYFFKNCILLLMEAEMGSWGPVIFIVASLIEYALQEASLICCSVRDLNRSRADVPDRTGISLTSRLM